MTHALKKRIYTVKNMQPSGFNGQVCNNVEISAAVKIHVSADEKQKIKK